MSTLSTQENKLPKEKYAMFWQRWEKNLRSCQSIFYFSSLFSLFVLLHFNTTKQYSKRSKLIFNEISKSLLPVIGTFNLFKGKQFDLQMQTLTRSFLQTDFASTQQLSSFHLQKLDLNTPMNLTCKNATIFHVAYINLNKTCRCNYY